MCLIIGGFVLRFHEKSNAQKLAGVFVLKASIISTEKAIIAAAEDSPPSVAAVQNAGLAERSVSQLYREVQLELEGKREPEGLSNSISYPSVPARTANERLDSPPPPPPGSFAIFYTSCGP